ncbi:MAG: DUF1579 family protein [Acidobacteria bacterium]|nr:DUF1579 family protein [Acidobacteriota bacterium]
MKTWILCGVVASGLCGQDYPAPKPTSHHLALKRHAGTWDAGVRMFPEPGKTPRVSEGVEVNRLVPGGLWLTSECRSEMGARPSRGAGSSASTPPRAGTWGPGWIPWSRPWPSPKAPARTISGRPRWSSRARAWMGRRPPTGRSPWSRVPASAS